MSGAENTKPGAEPSMDDILASIRKILNEDDAPGAPATIPEPPAEPLMLTEEMLVAEPAAPPPVVAAPIIMPPPPPAPRDPRPVVPPSVQVVTPPPEPRPQVQAPAVAPPPPPASELLAPAAAAAAAASMGQLLRAVTQERGSAISRGGPTIEDVVREEIRPLLKE